jgi:16S rRNA (adenine1518-N6/adenine1519-N6)-dimethyltransferase
MIRAKKSLVQNFLIDDSIIEKIVTTTEIIDKNIIEIGPGTGNLTRAILTKKPKKFFVVEKDNELSMFLKESFKEKIIIINEDILKINEKNITVEKLIVFGNLPYNISTEILCRWILNLKTRDFWFDELILMFQKEVAERIIARFNTSNYGRLTILANWKLNVKKICDIYPNSFSPRPKIDSTLLHFTPKEDFFEINDPKNLEIVTRIFFSHRRKMLKKPFNLIFNYNTEILDKLKIDLNLRPQNLDLNTYYNLTKEYENLRC